MTMATQSAVYGLSKILSIVGIKSAPPMGDGITPSGLF
jgi:hypothetical protein